MARLFGILATSSVVLAPIAALWLMGYYVFGSQPQPFKEASAVFILLGLPALAFYVYRRNRQPEYD